MSHRLADDTLMQQLMVLILVLISDFPHKAFQLVRCGGDVRVPDINYTLSHKRYYIFRRLVNILYVQSDRWETSQLIRSYLLKIGFIVGAIKQRATRDAELFKSRVTPALRIGIAVERLGGSGFLIISDYNFSKYMQSRVNEKPHTR